MLSDDWCRVQVYIPEALRYLLRTTGDSDMSDSKKIRKILYWISLPENQSLIAEILDS